MQNGAYTNQQGNTNAQLNVFSSNFGISPEHSEDIMAMAIGKVPAKSKRSSVLDAPKKDLEAGSLPGKLDINSESNIAYAKRANKMHALAEAGNLEGLEATQITGSNSYSSILRGYRDLLVQYLKKGS